MPLDLLFSVEKYPTAGMKIDATCLVIQGGGPIPNVMAGLHRLGHSTALITAVGDDILGRMGMKELNREGIDDRFVVRKKGRSDSAVGLIELTGGRRTMVLSRKIHVQAADIRPRQYPKPRIIHLDGRDMAATMKLARWGRRVGAVITFDIGSQRNDVSEVFPLVDHLVVADSFALPFTRCRSALMALRRLQNFCPGTVVVTEGIRGAVGIEKGELVRQSAFRVKVIDTTGAGDAFHTGYLFGLLRSFALARRLRFGAAVAAIKCGKAGARAGLPTLTTLNRFLSGNPPVYD